MRACKSAMSCKPGLPRWRLPKLRIHWCCSLSFRLFLGGLAAGLLLASSVPLWVGSQLLLSAATEKALGEVALLRAELAENQVLQAFGQMENSVGEQCRFLAARGVRPADPAQLGQVSAKLVTSIAGTWISSFKVQCGNDSHVGGLQIFVASGDTPASTVLLSSWSYGGAAAIEAAVVNRSSWALGASFPTGRLLDPLEKGRSAYADEELDHLFLRGLPLWGRTAFLPMVGAVATQFSTSCPSGGCGRLLVSGLYGALCLRSFLAAQVANDSMVYMMDPAGQLVSASAPWGSFAPWLDPGNFHSQLAPINASNFTEPLVAQTCGPVLRRLRQLEGAALEAPNRSEAPGPAAARVAASGVVRDLTIGGQGYFAGFRHVVSDQSRLSYILVAVVPTAERDRVNRRNIFYHLWLFLGCLAFMALVTAATIRALSPISDLTGVLTESCMAFFSSKTGAAFARNLYVRPGSARPAGSWGPPLLEFRSRQAVGDSSSPDSERLASALGSPVREIRWLARAAAANSVVSNITVKNTSEPYLRFVLEDPGRQGLYTVRLPSVTVLMVDLHDFASITERTAEPQNITLLLSSFFTHVENDIRDCGAPCSVARIGDAELFLFNSDLYPRDDEHARHAIEAAAIIHSASLPKVNADLRAKWPDCPARPVSAAVGIATGPVLAGNVGSAGDPARGIKESMRYDILGGVVNLAARITSAKVGPGGLVPKAGPALTRDSLVCVMSEATFREAFLRPRPPVFGMEGLPPPEGEQSQTEGPGAGGLQFDDAWLPPGVRLAECQPLALRNIQAPEAVRVLAQVD